MTFVSEAAFRELIRESLSTSEDKWTPLEDLEDLPILVNPSLDSNLGGVDGDVIDVQFTPHDKVEFEVAVKSLTKTLPDDKIATLYKRFRDLVKDVEGEDSEHGCEAPGVEEMKKTSNQSIVETIRKMVRKVIAEELGPEDDDLEGPASAPPASKRGFSATVPARPAAGRFAKPKDLEAYLDNISFQSDDDDEPVSPEERDAHAKMVDREEGFDIDTWSGLDDTSSVDAETASDWDPEEPASGASPDKKGRGKLGHGVGNGEHGKGFEEIATELGFSPAGIKRLEHVALAKLQYMLELGPQETSELVLDAVDDYITKLAKSGEISEEEVNYLYQNGDIVAELEGFREFLHAVIRKEMKKDGVEFYPKLGDDGKPVLDASGAQIHRGKKDGDDDDDS